MQASLTPERWAQIQRLFDEVIDLEPAARAARLEAADVDDPELRREVESLLAAHLEADDLLQSLDKIVGPLPEVSSVSGDDSHAGTRVGHYEVIEKLGGGGMGVVYKARDTRLKRVVALKFLPAQWSHHVEARQRFEHEAQAASALDHTNICTIHDIGETDDGLLFIAMAYYKGQTLKHRIKQGVSVAEALGYAAQMARGLEKAHAQGIVHRDIKPANIMITDDGVAKIVDFGPAKMADVQMTKTGATLGTVAYMSPEQARGEKVDARTDVWSLGVVLYEMLAGERPFLGNYDQAIVYSLINEEPTPITEANPEVPEGMAHVVAMCLEKEADLRYPSMTDLLADLDVFVQGAASEPVSASRAIARRKRKKQQRIALGAMVGVLLLLALVVAMLSAEEKHIAVVPFIHNLGEDPRDQALVDGLMQSVTGMIARLEASEASLWVVPAVEVRLRGVETPSDALRMFGVNRVVTGSVQRLGPETELTLDLVDPETMKILDTRTITASLGAAFQEQALQALGELLGVRIQAEVRQVVQPDSAIAPDAYAFYFQGLGYLQRHDKAGNLGNAITLFTQAIEEDARFALAYAGLCETYWQYYQNTRETPWIGRALQNCDHAIALNVQQAPVHVTLGRILHQRGQNERAEEELLRALKLEPNNTDAYRWLGWTYKEQGKAEQAEDAYKQAIATKPDYWVNYSHLGTFYFLAGRLGEAAQQYEQIIRLTPDNYIGYSNLGITQLDLGQEEKAQQSLEQSIALKPSYLAYLNLGRSYFRLKEYDEAARMYEKARDLNPNTYSIWRLLGEAYYWAGKGSQAQAAWQRFFELADQFLAVNPNHKLLLSLLATTHVVLGAPEEGRRYLGRLFALPTPDVYTFHFVGRAYEVLGERDLALRYLSRALEEGISPFRIETDPWLEALRADPGYQALRQQFVEAGGEPAL